MVQLRWLGTKLAKETEPEEKSVGFFEHTQTKPLTINVRHCFLINFEPLLDKK